jgi:hypothetical protein
VNTKIKSLQQQRKDAILKLKAALKDSEEGQKALGELMQTIESVEIDSYGLRKIVDFSLIAVKETYQYPTSDSKEVQAYIFASGIESFLLMSNIIPPFSVKKARRYGR